MFVLLEYQHQFELEFQLCLVARVPGTVISDFRHCHFTTAILTASLSVCRVSITTSTSIYFHLLVADCHVRQNFFEYELSC